LLFDFKRNISSGMKEDFTTFVTLDNDTLTLGDASFVDIDEDDIYDFVQLENPADMDFMIDTDINDSLEFIVVEDDLSICPDVETVSTVEIV